MESLPGPLVDLGHAPKARVTYSGMYYDQANRLTASVNVGTNSPSLLTRPDVPGRSDSVLVTSYTYDDAGRVQDVTDPRGIASRSLYDALGRTVTTIANYTNGTPTNDSNRTMAYTYDGSNHVVTATATNVLPAGTSTIQQTQFIYAVTRSGNSGVDSNDILAAIYHPDPVTGQPSAAYRESRTVNALGQTLTTTDQNNHTTSYAYNVLGQMVTVTRPVTDDQLPNVTRMTYDARGNLAAVTDPLSHAISYAYDGLHRRTSVTDPLNHTTTTTYDMRDNVTTVTDPLLHQTIYTYRSIAATKNICAPRANVNTVWYYDALNRRTLMTDALHKSTAWSYNVSGTQDTLTDAATPANTTVFVYDAFGRLSQQTDPLGHSAVFSYDRDSNLTSSTDRNNRTVTYIYDNLNRKTRENWGADDTLTYSYDAVGNLLTAANNASSYAMTYDAQNRTKQVSEPFGVNLTFSYDAVGNRTGVSDSLGGTETSTYNQRDELTSRQFTQGSVQIHVELDYFPDGQLKEQRNFASAPNEVALADYSYREDGRLITLVEKDSAGGTTPSNPVASYQYHYDDPAGRLTSKTENGTTTSYTYDDTNQLTGINGNPAAYGYDATGNRNINGFTPEAGNQLASDGTWNYTYDNEGNETRKYKPSGEEWRYTYDERNELTQAVHHSATGDLLLTATYKYDAFGNRIEEDVTQGGTTVVSKFALDGWKASGGHLVGNENWDVWADVSTPSGSPTTLTTRYLRGDVVDQLFGRIDGSTLTPFWYLVDNLGSIRNMVDNSGNTQDTVSYDPFGTITGETDASKRGRYGWTGREMEVETGLQYNRARYYDSTTGRWMSQDPLGFDAGDSNLYRYVKNQPTMATDPSGTWRWEIDSSGKIIAISEAGDTLGTLISQGYSKEMIVKIAGSGDLAKVLDRGTKLDISSLFPPALQKMIKDQQNTPTIGVPIGLSASVYRLPLGLLPQDLINQFQGPKLGSGQCYSFVALFKGIKAPPFKPSSWTDYLKIPWVIISNTIATIIRQYNPGNFSVSGTSNEGGKFGDLNAPGATPGTYLHIAGNLKPGVVVVPEQGLEKYITAGKQTANPMFGATVVFKDADNVFATIVHCGVVLGKSKNGDIMIIQKQNAFKTIVITTPRFWKTWYPTYWQ